MQSWFIVLLVLGCIATVSTNQCYTCTSPGVNGCEDPFNSNGVPTADAPAGSVCMKIKGTQAGSAVIIRSVVPAAGCPSGSNGCKSQTEQGVTGTVCCCDGNLCNGATTFRQQSLVGYVIVGILATVYYRFF